MEEYKKTYKGLFIFMLIYVLCVVSPGLFIEEINLTILFLWNISNFWIFLLMLYIYKKEGIYWITGVIYEAAEKMKSEDRKKYAYRHVKKFLFYSIFNLAYSILAYIIPLSFYTSFTVGLIGIVGTALSTMFIKLEKSEEIRK